VATALGLVTVLGLHLTAGTRERGVDSGCSRRREEADSQDYQTIPPPHVGGYEAEFIDACAIADIPENRARIVCLSGERVAIFKYDGKVSAVSNVCQHQNGPLGEGKILDGCI